ncbi:hypothetical protein [Paeniglutamicibacter sp. NPDC091659]|uniref:hypothetical protein n=1 Tax=Paeniglutamicibacter sp. NPDC091659 TaxID=3364389 RepID=UPI0037F1D844
MDKYVVNFEQAKQLKKAGFPQDTVYKFYQVIVTGEVKLIAGDYEDLTVGGKHTRSFAAPMTDELLEHLDHSIASPRRGTRLWLNMKVSQHSDQKGFSYGKVGGLRYSSKPPEALAILWLRANDNNYVEQDEKRMTMP